MLLRSRSFRRRASSLAESAITHAAVMLLSLGAIIVGLGIFRYQEISALAREGARWASVHGGQSQQDYQANSSSGSSLSPATASNVYTNAILPYSFVVQPTQSNVQLAYVDSSGNPSSSTMPTYVNASGNVVQNYVKVTVTCTWLPEAYLPSMTLSSSSTMAVEY